MNPRKPHVKKQAPGETPLGPPGSMARRAWELGRELAQARTELRALREALRSKSEA